MRPRLPGRVPQRILFARLAEHPGHRHPGAPRALAPVPAHAAHPPLQRPRRLAARAGPGPGRRLHLHPPGQARGPRGGAAGGGRGRGGLVVGLPGGAAQAGPFEDDFPEGVEDAADDVGFLHVVQHTVHQRAPISSLQQVGGHLPRAPAGDHDAVSSMEVEEALHRLQKIHRDLHVNGPVPIHPPEHTHHPSPHGLRQHLPPPAVLRRPLRVLGPAGQPHGEPDLHFLGPLRFEELAQVKLPDSVGKLDLGGAVLDTLAHNHPDGPPRDVRVRPGPLHLIPELAVRPELLRLPPGGDLAAGVGVLPRRRLRGLPGGGGVVDLRVLPGRVLRRRPDLRRAPAPAGPRGRGEGYGGAAGELLGPGEDGVAEEAQFVGDAGVHGGRGGASAAAA
mmetsp:Transcript_59851/g.160234  ORF Transcript_59851/g.160234 Transcript_59851/m.160234 type:complete len:391 (-) Transcript_59851:6-1178(-)